MNERIRELAKKSGFSLDSTGIYTSKLEHLPITENMDKFAELIIQDCIDCVDGYTKPRTFNTHYDAVEQIKANFGIE